MTYQKDTSSGFAGTVLDVLPKALYAVRLDDGRLIHCNVANLLRHGIVRVLKGDRVLVRVSRYDPHRGQIAEKF